ncbi:unnamed protein product [Amoebophrya sp. A25]|nr:unnamed protein product [Amoebophrya sp. A25]|eukprot:GSA25T00004466001.1
MPSEIIPLEIPLALEGLELGGSSSSKPGSGSGALGLRIGVDKIHIEKPVKKDANMLPAKGVKHILPSDCREGHFTYGGKLSVTFYTQKVNEEGKNFFTVDMGNIPVMVGSKVCHLSGLSPKDLVRAREDETERGGYFIMNGNERVIRLLIMPKANQLLAIDRSSFTNRGDLYTKHAVQYTMFQNEIFRMNPTFSFFQVRCMRRDMTTLTNTLHYCRDGSCFFRFSHDKNEYLIPMLVIAYAVAPHYMTDMLLARALCGGDPDDNFSSERVQVMFQTMIASDFPVHSKLEALQYLGDQFRRSLQEPDYLTDVEVGLRMCRRFFLVHSTAFEDKFSFFCLMFQKLMKLAAGKIVPENCDALSTQEALLPGQLYGAVLKEAIEANLIKAKGVLLKKLRYGDDLFDVDTVERVFWAVKDIDHAMNYFLATGTIKSRSGLDLMQVTGFTIVADKLNAVRYLSHFRAIHRGQFFMEMKTTAVRKLLPDSWGFLCPVHTPDGGPCGLLNHLAQNCQIALTSPAHTERACESVRKFLLQLGLLAFSGDEQRYLAGGLDVSRHYPVVLEGRVLGYVRDEDADLVVALLRRAKTMSGENRRATQRLWKKLMTQPVKPHELRKSAVSMEPEGEESGVIGEDTGPKKRARKADKKNSDTTKSSSTSISKSESADSENDASKEKTAAEEADRALTHAFCSVNTGPELLREAEEENCLSESELIWARKVLRADIQEYFRQMHVNVASDKALKADEETGKKSSASATQIANELAHRKQSSASAGGELQGREGNLSVAGQLSLQQEMEAMTYTHREIDPIKMLSIIASLTPFQNHNQSPRCMYQCQMLKQTMGTPYLNHSRRTDNKVYKIQFPQRPMVRAQMYQDAKFDTHPAGMNAIVAVAAYTGYDMEDAMIINKMSFDRGFMAGNVYKQKIIPATPDKDQRSRQQAANWMVSNLNPSLNNKPIVEDEHMMRDGTPKVGTKLHQGMPIACVVNKATGEQEIHKYKDADPCYIESVSLIGGGSFYGGGIEDGQQKLSLKLRFPRRPMVGDKFATRHGQKGVMATLWPSEDMPFSARGMVPDILFNPHGFPSRMTIGQLIESMAGKAAALEGRKAVNATAFRKYRGNFCYPDENEDDPFLERDPETLCDPSKQPAPAEYFGRILHDNGFDYYGTEELYDGVSGEPMKTHIFMGCVYYQRLRHMVADKAQVRALGPIDPITRQPVKGRQRGGGIRLGEMERDALVAHGTSYLLHDRLMRCSDYSLGFVCPECGSIITPVPKLTQGQGAHTGGPQLNAAAAAGRRSCMVTEAVCPPCTRRKRERMAESREEMGDPEVRCVAKDIPFVFRLLSVEFAAMGINLQMKLDKNEEDVYLPSPPEADVAESSSSGAMPIDAPEKKYISTRDDCYDQFADAKHRWQAQTTTEEDTLQPMQVDS